MLGDQKTDVRPAHETRFQIIEIDPGDVRPPFPVRRVYYIYGTTPGTVRGKHSHRCLRQLIFCVSGQCRIDLECDGERHHVLLDRPSKGLLIGPRTWREMSEFSPGCVLMVLASEPYDETDYIRDYDAYVAEEAASK